MTWNPDQYQRFADDRGRPFFDLAGRVRAENPRTVVDLGCGPGNLTVTLADRWPSASVTGIDSSPEMIAQAPADFGATFVVGDIASWQPGPDTDVVITNAALHWVPTHRELLRNWAEALPSGAWLAWQVPGNFEAPSHTLIRDVVRDQGLTAELAGTPGLLPSVDTATGYAELLLDAGWSADAWETQYVHVLPGEDAVLEWVRGTALGPLRAALASEKFAAFEAEYASRLRAAYPRRRGGTLFPFRRIFAVGHKP
ncbi:trans-aconitate 2-methyltransferase [Nakamurella panacisegetis]|uniref:trans-aconitate 2-methyltransferase n=1 Tax=Nakamurella panacisegetis TaxID=1090615 RepID=UPI000B811930